LSFSQNGSKKTRVPHEQSAAVTAIHWPSSTTAADISETIKIIRNLLSLIFSPSTEKVFISQ
jgi:hypothetical protein